MTRSPTPTLAVADPPKAGGALPRAAARWGAAPSICARRLGRASALVLLAALALPACQRRRACTSEVTEGNGTFRATKFGARPEADLRREALRAACNALCTSHGSGAADEACVSRCAVDAEAGKIGLRTSCKENADQ